MDAAIVKTTMKGLRRSLGTAQARKAPATNVVAKRLVDAMPDGSLKGRRDRAMVIGSALLVRSGSPRGSR
jgi:hypothetical protein